MTTAAPAAAEPATSEETETSEPNPDAEKGELFDRSQYEREDLAIPKISGNPIDKIRVKFGGSILLDRSDPADVALYNKLTLGKDVELRVAGKVAHEGGGYTTNRDGDLDAVVGEKSVKVDTVWVLDPGAL